MQDVLKKWTDALLDWLGATTQQHDDWDRWVAVALVLAVVVLFDFVCRFIAVHSIRRVVLRTKITWDDELFSVDVLDRACHILSALLLWGSTCFPGQCQPQQNLPGIVLRELQHMA